MLKKYSAITKIVSCFVILYLLTIVDFLSLAHAYFLKDGEENIEKYKALSRMIFLCSTFISQFSINIFTKISSGIAAGSIVENINNYTNLKTVILNYRKNKNIDTPEYEYFINNLVLILFFTTIIFSLVSFVLYKYNLFHLILKLPKSIIISVMCLIGYNQFKIFLQGIAVDENINSYKFNFIQENISSSQFILGLVSVLCLIGSSKLFADFNLLVPVYVLLTCVLFYFFLGLNYKFDTKSMNNFLAEKSFVSASKSLEIQNYFTFLKSVKLSLDFKLIVKCLPVVLSILFTSIIQMPINYVSYTNTVNIGYNSNLKNEHLTQTIINLISSVTLSPVYMIGCYSIFLTNSGASHKIFGMAAAFGVLTAGYTAKYFIKLIPKFVLASVPLYICFCFVEELLSEIFCFIFKRERKNNADLFDIVVSIIYVPFLVYLDTFMIFGVALGVLIYYVKYKLMEYKANKNNKKCLSLFNFDEKKFDIKTFNEEEYYYIDWFTRSKFFN